MAKKITVQAAHKPAADALTPEVPARQTLVDSAEYTQLLETVPVLIRQKNEAVAAATIYRDDLAAAVRCLSELGPALGLTGGSVSVLALTKVFSNMDKLKLQMAPLMAIIEKYTVPAAAGELQHG